MSGSTFLNKLTPPHAPLPLSASFWKLDLYLKLNPGFLCHLQIHHYATTHCVPSDSLNPRPACSCFLCSMTMSHPHHLPYLLMVHPHHFHYHRLNLNPTFLSPLVISMLSLRLTRSLTNI